MQSPISIRRTTASFSFRHPARKRQRRGVTIIEVLIATALALVMITAMVQIFAVIGEQVSTARATLEMSGQLRGASHRMRQDLNGITVSVRPWASLADGLGYFELIEGPIADYTNVGADASMGDVDDVIMFTARSDTEPFVGRWIDRWVDRSDFSFTTRESQIAEIVWWTRFNDRPPINGVWESGEEVTLYRRALIVRPDLNQVPFDRDGDGNADEQVFAVIGPQTSVADLASDLTTFNNVNDVSVRQRVVTVGTDTVIVLIANSLADLTKRENRFAHYPVILESGGTYSLATTSTTAPTYPYPVDINSASITSLPRITRSGDQLGEDVILSNVVGFDARVFDPRAAIETYGNVALVPGDPGYVTPPPASPTLPRTIGYGAFVDLNYGNGSTVSSFSGAPNTLSGLSLPTYCTWSMHYEKDGVDQDSADGADQATNGVDDDGVNGVDDPGERETSPPYPIPLRGIKVMFRVIELDTQQVRQTAVASDFIPE